MDYLKHFEKTDASSALWNVPEQKRGVACVIGGNAQNFRMPVKMAETLINKYPIKEVKLLLPDALLRKVPAMENIVFLSSTDSGSLASGEEILKAVNAADISLVAGDLSKNSITLEALGEVYRSAEQPIVVCRDAVDGLMETITDATLMNENLILFTSMAQLIKVFRAVYYPRVLTISQSFVQIAEGIHKFTLSYPLGVITSHQDQIIIAKSGTVYAVPLEKTGMNAITMMMGDAAARVMAMNLFNPGSFLEASAAAMYY